MAEVKCGERASSLPGLPCAARQGAQALRLTGSAWLPAPAGPARAAAAMDKLRATAARTLREHVGDNGICLRCHLAWPCGLARLAESALGAR
jgi:hypothetical protein